MIMMMRGLPEVQWSHALRTSCMEYSRGCEIHEHLLQNTSTVQTYTRVGGCMRTSSLFNNMLFSGYPFGVLGSSILISKDTFSLFRTSSVACHLWASLMLNEVRNNTENSIFLVWTECTVHYRATESTTFGQLCSHHQSLITEHST